MTDDPVRLRDGGSAFLKKALEAAKHDVPNADRAAALESKILPLVLPPLPPTVPPPGTGAAIKAGTAALGAKAGLGLAKTTMLAIAAAAIVAGAGVGAIVVGSSTAKGPPAPSGVVPPPVVSSVVAPEPTLALEPLPSASAAQVPSAKPVAKPIPSTDEADPALEGPLLHEAQDALRSSPAAALAKTQEHAKKYPRGLFVQEREVIAIEALVALGRTGEAEARAARFDKSFPGSTHKRRIDTLLGR